MSDWQRPTTSLRPFDKDQLDARSAENKKFFLEPSGMKFIDDHYGLRPGCIHTLMGSTGSGKSTLTQSLMLTWGRKNDAMIYLTEETPDRYELKLSEKCESAEYLSPNLHFLHEQEVIRDMKSDNYRGFLKFIEGGVAESNAKMLLIDNLTTSAFYDGKIENNIPILSGLRNIAGHYKIPIIVVVHTKKGVNEVAKGLMEPDDVRGSASIANTSDYFYTFYRIGCTIGTGTKVWNTFIYVNKSRDHDTQGNFYRLKYEYGRGYVFDEQISFNGFKQLMKERDKL